MKLKKRPEGGSTLLNNGFTLIELLAVIVILAIIALIATPIVLRIIDNSKTSAVVRSAELYMDSVEQAIMRENLNNEFSPSTCTIQSDGNLLCDDKELEIEVSGEKPTGGTITLEDGKITGVQDMLLGGYVLETDSKGNIVIKGTSSKEEDKEDELVNNNTYVDSVLNGADPELYNNLTAVTYDGENWVVADPSKKWYDYAKQEWANAVILKDRVTKNPEQTVDVETEVEAMFVWIPRYEYTIPAGTEGEKSTCIYGGGGYQYPYDCYMQPGAIEVNFISKDTTTPSSSEYHVHPAFTFGNTELNGIWVGKFKTTGNIIVYEDEYEILPTILPNIMALTDSISNNFNTAQKINSLYLKNSKLDSHMIKNSEWGAVAYLSQSIYGKYGNASFDSTHKEIYRNSSTLPGYTGYSHDDGYYYYTYDGYLLEYDTNNKTTTRDILKGTGASTTGNIYGIYDTSSRGEVVMGVLFDASTNKPYYGESGFTDETFPTDSKYYDKYTTEDETTACNGNICYGHALSETSNWYGDGLAFVSLDLPWIVRSGASVAMNDNFGIFFRFGGTGEETDLSSYHIVLSAS